MSYQVLETGHYLDLTANSVYYTCNQVQDYFYAFNVVTQRLFSSTSLPLGWTKRGWESAILYSCIKGHFNGLLSIYDIRIV